MSFAKGRSVVSRGSEVYFYEGPKCLDEGPKCGFEKGPKGPKW